MKKLSLPQTQAQRATVSSKNKRPLPVVVQALDASRADPAQAKRDLTSAFTQGIQETLKELENRGYQKEVQGYLNLVAAAQQQNNRE